MIFDALVGGFIRQNWPRAAMSIAAIALGIAISFGLLLTKTQLVESIDSDRNLLAQRVDLQILPFGSRLPHDILARVRYLDGISFATPVIDRPITVGVDEAGDGGDSARLVGVDLLQPLMSISGFDEGRPGPFAPIGSFIDPRTVIGTNGAIVSSEVAGRLKLRTGTSFNALIGATVAHFHVANIMPLSAAGIDSSVIFVNITTAQHVLHDNGAADRIDIIASKEDAGLQTALSNAVAGQARVSTPTSEYLSLSPLVSSISATFSALAFIGLAVGGLLIHGVVETSILHRRGDIGTLRTIGASKSSIVFAFIGEGLVYGAIGGLLGAALAILSTETVGKYAGFDQTLPVYNVWTVALAVLFGMAVAGLSSVLPALSSASISPALVARQGSFGTGVPRSKAILAAMLGGFACCASGAIVAATRNPGSGFLLLTPLCFAAASVLFVYPVWASISALLRGATGAAPPFLHLACLNLASIPGRIGVALAALSVAVFAAVAFDLTISSFQIAVDSWAKEGIAGDIFVRPAGRGGTFDADVLARVRLITGVRDAAGLRTVYSTFRSQTVAVRGEDDNMPREKGSENFATLSAPLAARLHIQIGDHLDLPAANGNLHLRVTAIVPDFSNQGEAIVIARRLLEEAFEDDHLDAIRIFIRHGATPTNVETELARTFAPERILTVTTSELRDRFTGVFDATFTFVRLLALMVVLIAAMGIASALSAFIFERRFELKMLRTLGTRQTTTMQMLMVEAFVIATIGSGLGVLTACAFVALNLYVTQPLLLGFRIPLNFPIVSASCIVAAVLVAATLSPLTAARNKFGFAAERRD
jgi:putative ABC transport system permease protein